VIVRLEGGQDAKVTIRNDGQLGKAAEWRNGEAVKVGWRPEDAKAIAVECDAVPQGR
jgi:hypothetical protein